MNDDENPPIVQLLQCIMNAFVMDLAGQAAWPTDALPAKLDQAIIDGSLAYAFIRPKGTQCSTH